MGDGKMTKEKVLSVLRFYRDFFEEYKIPCRQLSGDEYDRTDVSTEALLMHAHWMAKEMQEILGQNPKKIGKANRWLGHIQGLLVSSGVFSMNELKNHSRP